MRLMLLQDHLSLIEEDGALAEDIRSQNEYTGMIEKVPARMERTARANSTCRHLGRRRPTRTTKEAGLAQSFFLQEALRAVSSCRWQAAVWSCGDELSRRCFQRFAACDALAEDNIHCNNTPDPTDERMRILYHRQASAPSCYSKRASLSAQPNRRIADNIKPRLARHIYS